MSSKLTVAAIAALTIAAAVPAAAQQQTTRDQAIAKCVSQAQQQYPSDMGDGMRNRTSAYKACMANLGFES